LESIAAQSFGDYEVLVLDDGSTDRSGGIAEQYAKHDHRVLVIHFEKNRGLIGVLNEGLRRARGEYIARLDSDDEWNIPEKLEFQVKFLDEHTECGLIGTGARVIHEDGTYVRTMMYPTSDREIRNKFLIKNQFIHSSIVARKQVIDECGGYRSDEPYAEDYGLWLRIGARYTFSNVPIEGVLYRINPKGETRTKNKAQVCTSWNVVMKHRRVYPHFYRACLKWGLRYCKALMGI